ncbi:Diatom spindle kinesin-1 [Phytophthora citrophthora]|uniref:Diatom spindle kinesin-1 n=1 Tax=Phytophthora citrophthora TaxID=4793 RepID=A0AAD9GB48_9STRA|nr:Diatom spindle kinesin-1 [Phytophthora citrophthora]
MATARKVHAADFQRTLRELRRQYLEAKLKADGEENEDNRATLGTEHMHVYVRKRPLLSHELQKHEFDVITAVGQREIVIHECKMYPDMRHKYVVSHHQRFSTCYNEKVDTETIYEDAVKHLLLHTMEGGKAVCMMYGQTGSGKTYTMSGLFQFIADDLFTELVGDVDFVVSVSAVEIVGSKCHDLIHDRAKVLVCDDGEGNTGLVGTTEVEADSTNALLEVLDRVKDLRSTESTSVNHQSSRSHLVCYINLRHRSSRGDTLGDLYGQLVLLDLAGSERNEDSFYHDAARRKEAIEINKSHLALKECVRAIGREDSTGFVPYRASVLTRILKSCLWSMNSRASVIATISPLSIDTEHTLHTLLCAGQMLEDTPHISTDRVDVKEAGEDDEERAIPIREWDNDRVRNWICSVRKGKFQKFSDNVNSSVDGRMLIRFTHARFTQLCGGNSLAGGHLLKAFRDEVANQDKSLKARRERNAARRK